MLGFLFFWEDFLKGEAHSCFRLWLQREESRWSVEELPIRSNFHFYWYVNSLHHSWCFSTQTLAPAKDSRFALKYLSSSCVFPFLLTHALFGNYSELEHSIHYLVAFETSDWSITICRWHILVKNQGLHIIAIAVSTYYPGCIYPFWLIKGAYSRIVNHFVIVSYLNYSIPY